MRVTALAGGGGAAKFLRGLVLATDPKDVTVIGNTGDDAVFHGLHVSPDLDIVTYTLAGVIDDAGWGIRSDTTNALDQLATYGVETWFTLRDRDLGTHMARTTWLDDGVSLSEITDRIRIGLGVETKILPMSDEPVRTKITTAAGIERDFQEYFVRFRHSEEVAKIRFEGASSAKPAPSVLEAIMSADRIIICPSNPAVSIGPILAVAGIREALAARRGEVFAISPIIEGVALKGPADKLMGLLGAESSASGVASVYRDICGTFVIDQRDAPEAAAIEKMDMRVMVLETVMSSEGIARQLAKEILALR
ncbi:MAG: 2-phospho-L-lactate transferase [Actinomycetota bacterium]|nr:2-phospho-L-lactate transferase [Actinomycetota bacterium]